MTPWRRLAILALATSALLAGPQADAVSGNARDAILAQISFPNPFNAAKGAAVRQALSEFGSSIGAQMPIVVGASDAYPTASLPGAPFSPGRVPSTVLASLRASTDGTGARSVVRSKAAR